VAYAVCPEECLVLELKVMRARAIHDVVARTARGARGARGGEAVPPVNIQPVAAPPVRV
jgi:hypothetical protein